MSLRSQHYLASPAKSPLRSHQQRALKGQASPWRTPTARVARRRDAASPATGIANPSMAFCALMKGKYLYGDVKDELYAAKKSKIYSRGSRATRPQNGPHAASVNLVSLVNPSREMVILYFDTPLKHEEATCTERTLLRHTERGATGRGCRTRGNQSMEMVLVRAYIACAL